MTTGITAARLLDIEDPLVRLSEAGATLDCLADGITENDALQQAVRFMAVAIQREAGAAYDVMSALCAQARGEAGVGDTSVVIANETVTIDAKDFHNCHVQVDNISDAVEAIAKKLGVTV